MKNRLIKKALCVALASTMVFGDALPAMAADGSADVQSAQAEVAFAEEASITYFSVGGQDTVSSGSVHISALGYGKQELESSLRLQEEQREPLLQAAGKAEEERKKNPELQRKAEELEGEIRKIRERMERILRIETLGQKTEKLGEELEKVQKKCQADFRARQEEDRARYGN